MLMTDLIPRYRPLEDWSKELWKSVESSTSKELRFIQQGYEQKGIEHIQQIIENVDLLLVEYCRNEPYGEQGWFPRSHEKEKQVADLLKPNLQLFHVVAHLHDIGMVFPGIFKPLSDLVPTGGREPLHIGEIVHRSHHYATFIIMMELFWAPMDNSKPSNDSWMNSTKYLKHLVRRNGGDIVHSLSKLSKVLEGMRAESFKSMERDEFLPLLALLCLYHKEHDAATLDSIVRHLEPNAPLEGHGWQGLLSSLRKWQAQFDRARTWQENAIRWHREQHNVLARASDYELREIGGRMIDILLVEALLQYGDKTDISVTRLHRSASGDSPLKSFLRAIENDEREGHLCTEIARNVLSPFARYRASRFLSVLSVKPRRAKPDRVDVVIHYWKPEELDDDTFRLIRHHSERDFVDLGFLDVVRFHFPMLIHEFHLRNRKGIRSEPPVLELRFLYGVDNKVSPRTRMQEPEEEAVSLVEAKSREVRERHKGISTSFPFTSENKRALRSYSPSPRHRMSSNRPPTPEKAFYETPDYLIPGSFEILAILNVFLDLE